MAPKPRRPDLTSPSKLDRISASLQSTSESHITTSLDEDGLGGKREEAVCKKALEKWTTPATSRLKDNVTFNGVSWKSATKKGKRDNLEKLDTQLQTKVSNLSQTIDILMEEAVTNRREAPLRYAEALKARMEALEYVRDRLGKQWESVHSRALEIDEDEGEVRRIVLQGQDEESMRRVWGSTVSQAELLAETLPQQIETTQQQRELVEQLRSMPA